MVSSIHMGDVRNDRHSLSSSFRTGLGSGARGLSVGPVGGQRVPPLRHGPVGLSDPCPARGLASGRPDDPSCGCHRAPDTFATDRPGLACAVRRRPIRARHRCRASGAAPRRPHRPARPQSRRCTPCFFVYTRVEAGSGKRSGLCAPCFFRVHRPPFRSRPDRSMLRP